MAFPTDFILRTRALLGDEYTLLEQALCTEPPVSIRLNTRKIPVPAVCTERVPWCRTGFYLPQRLPFTFDPLFHAGAYYVQEAASMFLEQAIQNCVTTPVKCLDLCAAPGGKSTHLAGILPEGSLLVSNEVIRNRSYILNENLIKWGYPDILVTNNDPEEIGRLTGFFDVIVADVPCSGEGMFRKDTASAGEWSVANVELCAARQRRIIQDVWNALRPGGLLIYSTCTYNTDENEENMRYITEKLGAEAVPLPVLPEWNITGPLAYNRAAYRFLPHRTKGEGFFLAVMRKTGAGASQAGTCKHKKKEKKKTSVPVPADAKSWISRPEQYEFETVQDTVRAFSRHYYSDYQQLAGALRLLHAGIEIGKIKGKDLQPAQALALSLTFDRNAFPSVEIGWKEAIGYLRREPVVLPDTVQKGYVLLTCDGLPLGFVKQLGNRTNNLYPQEWRIRTSHLPESEPSLLR
ncbi:MAG: RsmB/NOP family class I SAM-dependent RNA methyltransferase [Parabacteroides sp.]|nr:RsmB/NOP family class I SAM-dependent RNA methyltransferase [Parabacteroides sp.]